MRVTKLRREPCEIQERDRHPPITRPHPMEQTMRRTVFLGAILGMTAIVAARAADSTGPGARRQNVTVSFSAGTASAAALSDTSHPLRAITATSGTDVLVINKAQVGVAR